MDPSQVENHNVTYQQGIPQYVTGEEVGLWMCSTKQDIPLDTSKIAYVIVPDDGITGADKIKKFWEEGTFYVPLITRDVADLIRLSIKAVHIHNVPKHWKTYWGFFRLPTGLNYMVAN